MTIEIANARDLPPPSEWPPHFVYVGREAPRKGFKRSPLANPFRVGMNPNIGYYTRRETVAVYRERVIRAYNAAPVSGDVWDELARLRALLAEYGRLTLVCWCETWDGTGEAPGRCHAEVIKEYLETPEL